MFTVRIKTGIQAQGCSASLHHLVTIGGILIWVFPFCSSRCNSSCGITAKIEMFGCTIYIADGSAVRGDISAEAPLVAQDIGQQHPVARARQSAFAINSSRTSSILLVDIVRNSVICRHYALNVGTTNAHLKSGQIKFTHILLRYERGSRVTTLLVIIGSEVFRTCHNLKIWIFCCLFALYALDEMSGKNTAEEGIFTIIFFFTSPTRIA